MPRGRRRRWTATGRDRPGRAAGPVAGPRGRRRHGDPDGRTAARPGRAGRTARCRPPGSARICGTSAPCCAEHGLRGTPYGHFGDGCIHVRIDFDLMSDGGRAAASARFSEELADLVVAHGGSLSGEHGDGQARAELLPRMYGDETGRPLRAVQGPLGPGGRPEPRACWSGPRRLDENLRFAVLPREPGRRRVRLPARRRRLLGGGAPVRRRRQVPYDEPTSGRGRDVPVVPGDGRGAALHARAGPAAARDARRRGGHGRLAVGRRCGTRSTCACPARAAAATARWASTWPRTRRSSCTTTTRAGCARPRTTRWAGCRGGCGWPPPYAPAPLVNAAGAGCGPLAGAREAARRDRAGARRSRALARGDVHALVAASSAARPDGGLARRADGRPVAGHLHRPPLARGRAGRPCGSWRRPGCGVARCPPEPGCCCGLTYVSTGQLDRARAVMRRTLDLMEPVLDAGRPGRRPGAELRGRPPHRPAGTPARRPARAPASPPRVRTFAQALEEYAPDWEPPRLDRPVAGQTHCHQHAVLGDAADRRLRERRRA